MWAPTEEDSLLCLVMHLEISFSLSEVTGATVLALDSIHHPRLVQLVCLVFRCCQLASDGVARFDVQWCYCMQLFFIRHILGRTLTWQVKLQAVAVASSWQPLWLK